MHIHGVVWRGAGARGTACRAMPRNAVAWESVERDVPDQPPELAIQIVRRYSLAQSYVVLPGRPRPRAFEGR
eukprot:11173282-Lingulodinium_polyedra.AAC.1